jgi:DNA-binding NarL/FixJ family response regulator
MIAIADDAKPRWISRRQLLVIDRLSTGKPAKVVASDLKMTIHIVHNDVQNAIKALNAGNSAGLIGIAFREGWIA